MNLRQVFEHFLPMRVVEPENGARAKAVIDHARLIQARARQIELEAELSRGRVAQQQ